MEDFVAKLPIEKKIGQILNLRLAPAQVGPTEISKEMAEIIREYGIGGVTLFGSNIINLEQTVKLTYDLQQAAEISLMIMTDQEGGVTVRTLFGTEAAGNMALGASGNYEHARQIGRIFGRELSSLGINVDLAPVMDVNTDSNISTIGMRSFGQDPKEVAKLGISFMKGLQSEGTISCAKHFPGHGDTDVDSHQDIAHLNKSLKEIEGTELVPFQAIIAEGVDCVMMAHIHAKSLDDSVVTTESKKQIPALATFSQKIQRDLLRKKLGFEGIIMTDALDMGAIRNYLAPAEASLLALKAGANALLLPITLYDGESYMKFKEFFADLQSRIMKDEQAMKNLDDSVRRILALKKKYRIEKGSDELSKLVENASKIITCEEHKLKDEEITKKCITVVQDVQKILPVKIGKGSKIFIYTNRPLAIKEIEPVIDELIPKSTGVQVKISFVPELNDEVMKNIEEADVILLVTCGPLKDSKVVCEGIVNHTKKFAEKKLVHICMGRLCNVIVPPIETTTVLTYSLANVSIKMGFRGTLFFEYRPDLYYKPEGKLPTSIRNEKGEIVFKVGHSM